MAGAHAGRHRYLHGTSVHWPLFRGRRARAPTFPRRNPVRGVEGSAHFADDKVEAQGSGAVPETTQRGRGRPGAKAVPSCAMAWRERGRTRSTCDPAFPAPAPRPPPAPAAPAEDQEPRAGARREARSAPSLSPPGRATGGSSGADNTPDSLCCTPGTPLRASRGGRGGGARMRSWPRRALPTGAASPAARPVSSSPA